MLKSTECLSSKNIKMLNNKIVKIVKTVLIKILIALICILFQVIQKPKYTLAMFLPGIVDKFIQYIRKKSG